MFLNAGNVGGSSDVVLKIWPHLWHVLLVSHPKDLTHFIRLLWYLCVVLTTSASWLLNRPVISRDLR